MPLRRIAVVLGLAALAACRPSVGERSSPSHVDYAVFDPSTSRIPLPNDLALQSAASLPAGAQKEFLGQLVAAGGFPNDQEVPITIQFVRQAVGGAATPLALDPASIKLVGTVAAGTATVGVVDITTPTAPTPVTEVEPSYDATTGTLTIRNKQATSGSRAWPAGKRFAVLVRGGANGVKTADGGEVEPMPTFAILRGALANGLSLTDPVNQALLPGSASEKAAAGAQLEQIRLAYRPLVPLAAALRMPIDEDVSLQTFGIAPLSPTNPTVVLVDESAGKVPLPFDLLRDPGTGKVVNNPAFGSAAAGLATLDGFSTTALLFAPTSAAIDAGTVNGVSVAGQSVFLYKLGGAAPALVKDLAQASGGGNPAEAGYLSEPPPVRAACPSASGTCSSIIALAPAVVVPLPSGGTLYMPPLEEKTTYAVVVTNRVKDAAGKPLGRSTFAKIVLALQNPVYANGASQLSGVPNAQAQGIEQMRTALGPVFSALPSGITKDDVAFAYTFTTQTVTDVSVQLSAAPYADPAKSVSFTPVAGSVQPFDPNPLVPGLGLTFPDVDEFISATVVTLDALDPENGALQADSTKWTPLPLPALIAVPKAAAVTNFCPGSTTVKCAPLVVFQHNLFGMRYTMIFVANELARRGFVVAAIDQPFHGDRAFCSDSSQCAMPDGSAGTCTPDPARANQGDAPGPTPGTCTGGSRLAIDLTHLTTWGPRTLASGNFALSANLFRTRDGIRQAVFDAAALVLNLARPPSPFPQPSAPNPVAAALFARPGPIAIDPTRVYSSGLSLGGLVGLQISATNPRIARATSSPVGGTIMDILLEAPSFGEQRAALFAALGIDLSQVATDPAVAAKFLQTVHVAKWILDPADPVNYAKHVKTKLASPLTPALGALASATTDAYYQFAQGDLTIPNPTNFLVQKNTGTDATGANAVPFTLYQTSSGGDVEHFFLASRSTAQQQLAEFLVSKTTPATEIVQLP